MIQNYEFTAEGGAFKQDFPHLYNRVSNLQEMIVSYFRSDCLYKLLPYGMSADDAPKIQSVSFEETHAKTYERTAEHFFSSRFPKGEASVPKPKFAVTLGIDFRYGQKGVRVFDFREWDEETLTAFCSEIKARGKEAFRLGYRPMG